MRYFGRSALSDCSLLATPQANLGSLNAPFGARRFLTRANSVRTVASSRINAPFGARCFLTLCAAFCVDATKVVLMHRLVRAADGFANMLHVIPGLLF